MEKKKMWILMFASYFAYFDYFEFCIEFVFIWDYIAIMLCSMH